MPLNKFFLVAAIGLLLLASSGLSAQTGSKTDSLKRVISSAPEDSNKVKLLNALSATLSASDPAEGVKWATDARKLAQKIGWQKGEVSALMMLGNNKLYLSDFAAAAKCYDEAAEISRKRNDKAGIGKAINAKAKMQLMQANYPEALKNSFEALKIGEEINDEIVLSQSYSTLGSIYLRQAKSKEALAYYRKAEVLYEKLGDQRGLGMVLSNLGAIHLQDQKYDTALVYLKSALAVNERLGSLDLVGMNIANIAGVYMFKKMYNLSLAYSFRSLHMNTAMGDMNNKGIDEMNIGMTYLKAARDSTVSIKPDSLMPATKAQVVEKAIFYLETAKRSITEVSGDLNALTEVYSSLSEAYHLAGKNDLGFRYGEMFIKLRDSVFSMDNRLKMANLQTDRARFEKEKQVKLNRVTLAKKRNETIFFSIGILLLIITVVFVTRERRKSDKLLLNILPEEVAKELKKTGSTTAQHYNDVTVLFTDFVNFTTVGERLSPQALVDELHACFKAFDEITSKYNIEKIKTVGDAYLAVAGLPVPDSNHAKNVVKAAMEIVAFVTARKAQLGENAFEIRVGVNSGNVVAGIVGVKKFAYDIWGDTVNIASRMEQSSEPGKINISGTTYELVKDDFSCTYRGEIEVKNKGKMAMYFVGTGA